MLRNWTDNYDGKIEAMNDISMESADQWKEADLEDSLVNDHPGRFINRTAHTSAVKPRPSRSTRISFS